MAECIECDKSLDYRNTMPNGRCSVSHGKHLAARMSPLANAGAMATNQTRDPKTSSFSQKRQRQEAIEAILLTTETAPNLNITKRIEIVTAECAFGMNIFKDLFAGVRDIVGGRSKAVQNTLRDSRRTALYELKKEAYEVGANAVVGVDLDYMEMSSAGSMVLLVASGTAVIIEEK